MISEKNTDFYMQTEFKKIFNIEYSTGQYERLFNNLKPDGFYKCENYTFIIENKQSLKSKDKGLQQLKNYYEQYENKNEQIYFILGLGNTQEMFQYIIYEKQGNEFVQTEKKLQSFSQIIFKTNSQTQITNVVHNIHDIIRSETKLSNEDKPLFIGSILLGLQIPSFCELINTKNLDESKLNGKQLSQILIDKIRNEYEDEGMINSIQFLTKTFDNKVLFNISKMTNQVCENNKNIDVLNIFYTEFVKYQSTDSKSLGIVLTPHHIIELMIRLLDLKKEDIFLDLCTGTGSFLKQASQFCQVIGCEYQTKLYTLCKMNIILTGKKQNKVYHSDCFECKELKQYQFTKSAINPPYGDNINPECKFIYEQLQHIQENGLCCAIVPENVFNSTKEKENNKSWKQKIFECSKVLRIIKCSKNLFCEAKIGVSVCIILLQKSKQGNLNNITCLQNYEDDGYAVKIRCGRQPITKEIAQQKMNLIIQKDESISEYRQLTLQEDWKMKHKQLQFSEILDKMDDMETDEIIKKYVYEKQKQKQQIIQKIQIEKQIINISDLFEYIGRGKRNLASCQEGEYPLISASKFNNGISGYISEYDYDGFYITVACDGNSSGYAFIQNGKFSANTATHVLKIKIEMDLSKLQILCKYISVQLNNKYNYTLKLSKDKLMNEKIQIPTNECMKQIQQINQHFEIQTQIFMQKLKMETQIQNQFVQEYEYKISDLFKYIGRGKRNLNKCQNGEFPYIAASKQNNGEVQKINEYDYDGDYFTFVTDGDGGCGFVFFQQGKFACSNHILICQLKLKINIEQSNQLAKFISIQFHNKYNRYDTLNKERLMNETILLPWLLQKEDDVIQPQKLESLNKNQLIQYITDNNLKPIKKDDIIKHIRQQ